MSQQKYKPTAAFPEPEYTQTPNKFFEMLPDMHDSEVRVTLVMIRETFGFHRDGFKMGVTKLAKAAGLSRQGALVGAMAAEERGTFRRTNPDAITEAEWELVVALHSVDTPLHSVEGSPQAGGGQVGVKERVKKELKKSSSLSQEEMDIEAKKLEGYLRLQSKGSGLSWVGREVFYADHLPLVDWYHGVTGQTCPKSKRADWLKAIRAWEQAGLTVEDLQAAYDTDIKWRKVYTSPNQLTATADALKAQKTVKSTTPASIPLTEQPGQEYRASVRFEGMA